MTDDPEDAAAKASTADVALDVSDDDGFEIVLNAHAAATHGDDRDPRPTYTWTDEVPPQSAATAATADPVASALLSSKLRQFTSKLQIQLEARNPLPSLCRAIQESHLSLEHDTLERKLSPGFWVPSPLNAAAIASNVDGARFNVPSIPSTPVGLRLRNRDDMLVAKLPPPVQRAFRQRVLRRLLVVKCGIATVVCACIALLPFDAWRQQQSASQSWLPHALLSTCAVLYALTLGLLYGVRHDFPINGAVLVFLLGVELCCALLWSLVGNLNAIAAGSALYIAMLAGVYLFATWRRTKQTQSDDFELLHPLNSAVASVAVAVALSSAVYCSGSLPGLSKSSISPWTFAAVLARVTLAGIWTGLTLHCMCASLAPDEYARCLIFYHSDAFVVCCVAPYHWCLKRWRAAAKALRRSASTAPAQSSEPLAESSSETTNAPATSGAAGRMTDGGVDADDIGALEAQRVPEGITSPTRRRSSVVAVV